MDRKGNLIDILLNVDEKNSNLNLIGILTLAGFQVKLINHENNFYRVVYNQNGYSVYINTLESNFEGIRFYLAYLIATFLLEGEYQDIILSNSDFAFSSETYQLALELFEVTDFEKLKMQILKIKNSRSLKKERNYDIIWRFKI